MKNSGFVFFEFAFSIIIASMLFTNCNKSDKIKFPFGTFPDTVVNISDINSPFDDYNIALHEIDGDLPIIFSSNRKSSGGQFDLEQGTVSFSFNQETGAFEFKSKMTTDAFLDKLINKAVTPGNDFGPYRLFSTVDGYEYLILSSVNQAGNLDLYYLRNQPSTGAISPVVSDPLPVTLMNTASDDAYFSFNFTQDTAYFCSGKDGNFDIFYLKKPEDKDLASWFSLDYLSPVKPDNINGSGDDKCPFIYKQIMVFTSNREGGYGGYDLYYSVLKNGSWGSPVNLGPHINSAYDEYRPVLGNNQQFTNKYLMFSSNRPGGKGGFDLYFTGVSF